MKRSCVRCGCTEERPCVVEVAGVRRGCRWVAPQLCSACSGAETLVAGPPPQPARVVGGVEPAAMGPYRRGAAGELIIEISHADGLVILDFGMRGKKIGVDPSDAITLAAELKQHAEAARTAQ